jgi:hypothetical protein
MATVEIKPSGFKPGVKSVFIEIENITDSDIKNIRKKLKQLIKSEVQISNAFSQAFVFAVTQNPEANPSDVWQHVIYRGVLDLGLSDQQWKRISGFALERAFADIYNPRFKKLDLRIRPLPRKEAHDLLSKLGFRGEIKKDKIDCVIEQFINSDWAMVAGVHIKASLAERIQDDVPASLALMKKKLLSIVVTLDSKSYPPPHGNGVNYGELGGRSWADDKDKSRIKRQYIEEDGQFDALFSFNLRTPPSPEKTPSSKKIYTLGMGDQQPDSFVRFITSHLKRAIVIKE